LNGLKQEASKGWKAREMCEGCVIISSLIQLIVLLFQLCHVNHDHLDQKMSIALKNITWDGFFTDGLSFIKKE
jgi:hypothetical protein